MRDDNSVVANLQAVAGTRPNRSEYNKDVIDTFLLRRARQRGIRLPTGDAPDEDKFLGAFVETPTAGINHNVVYCDLASLYPNNIRTLNASPETLIGTQADLEASEYTADDCVHGYIDPRPVKHLNGSESGWRQFTDGEYKIVYDDDGDGTKWTCDEDNGDGPQYEKLYFLAHDVQEGFLPSCVGDVIAMKNQYRGTPLYGAIKRITNSLYGTVSYSTSDSSFRLFNNDIAESITLLGRRIIQASRDFILQYCHEQGFDEAYACSGDTDATAVALPSAATRHEALSVVGDAVEILNDEKYDEILGELVGVDPEHNHTEIEIESYSPKLFIPSVDPPHDPVGVKKRYISWETWNDDDGECDDIAITGLEAERSDVAPITVEAQEAFAETLRQSDSDARAEVFPKLRAWASAIENGEMALSRIGKRGGIGQSLDEYGSATRRPAPIYRGAKYATEHIDGVTIQDGGKPQIVYIKDIRGDEYPSVYDAKTAEHGDRVDAVALPDPDLLPEDFVVDYQKHYEKALKEPMEPLIETRGWSWSEIRNQHVQQSLGEVTG